MTDWRELHVRIMNKLGLRSRFAPPAGLSRKAAPNDFFARCDRDEYGYCVAEGGAGAGTAERPPPRRRRRARGKETALLRRSRNAAVRRRVLHGLRNEGELADAVDGFNLPDSEAADVIVLVTPGGEEVTDPEYLRSHMKVREDVVRRLRSGTAGDQEEELRRWLDGHRLAFIEVKTLVTSKAGAIRMSAAAVARKRRWENRFGAAFSTVCFDDRRGHKYSGTRLYFRPGVGSTTLARMKPVGSFEAVLALLLED
jgi:hypothetical protein